MALESVKSAHSHWGKYKWVIPLLLFMPEDFDAEELSDVNQRFRDYYAEQGVSEADIAAFDMSRLDYVHWGNASFGFPSFFSVSYPDSLEAWAYTGYHGKDGIRLSPYTFTVGSPDPRFPDGPIIHRIVSATDLNNTPIIMLDFADQRVSDIIYLPIWINLGRTPEELEPALQATFGSGEITVALWDDPHNVSQDYQWSAFLNPSKSEEE